MTTLNSSQSKLIYANPPIVYDPIPSVPELLRELSNSESEVAAAATALRSVILLGGSVRRAGFTAAIGRSLLDLPLAANRSVMDRWMAEISGFQQATGSMSARLILDEQSMLPSCVPAGNEQVVTIERDPRRFRGTGGLLSDLARSYDFQGWMLVVNAAQVLRVPLVDLYMRLLETCGEVRLISEDGGRVGGVMLIRCDALRDVPEIGYCDFKEQVLNAMGEEGRIVGITKMQWPSSFSLRERFHYLDAVAMEQGCMLSDEVSLDPTVEEWQRRFAIVEAGAMVHSSALVHDSVVLNGARVGPRAAIIRSVLGPKAVIASGQVIRDSVIA